MVLFPLVALTISTLFEGYQWTAAAACGVALVVAGNVLMIMPKAYRAQLSAARAKAVDDE